MIWRAIRPLKLLHASDVNVGTGEAVAGITANNHKPPFKVLGLCKGYKTGDFKFGKI